MADAGAAQPMTIFANVAFQHAKPSATASRVRILVFSTCRIVPCTSHRTL